MYIVPTVLRVERLVSSDITVKMFHHSNSGRKEKNVSQCKCEYVREQVREMLWEMVQEIDVYAFSRQ